MFCDFSPYMKKIPWYYSWYYYGKNTIVIPWQIYNGILGPFTTVHKPWYYHSILKCFYGHFTVETMVFTTVYYSASMVISLWKPW